MTISAKDSSSGQTAALTIGDNTAAGKKYVELSRTGVAPPAALNAAVAPKLAAQALLASNTGTYYQLAPARILDTRDGTGAAHAPLGQDSTLGFQVAGRGGVPSSGVSAVVLNVTTTGATGDSYLTVYPSGVPRPTASSLNFVRGWTGANSVTVAVGAGGQVSIYNHVGSTEVIADVVGFYAADSSMVDQLGSGAPYHPVSPYRAFDSRTDWGYKLPGGYSVRVPVDYGDELNQHIRALAVNVTSVDAEWAGYLSTWNGVDAPPGTSTVNYTRGATVPNMAIVPVAWCYECDDNGIGFPAVGVYTHANTNVIVDVVGVFDDGFVADGLRFTPRTPVRIADSRIGLGTSGALGQFGQATVTPPADVAPPQTWALALNVTAVTPTALTFLTVWPDDGQGMPDSSNLNPSAGQTVPNAVYTAVGSTKAFKVYNNVGLTHLVVDVVGTFAPDAEALGARSSARSLPPANKPLVPSGSQPDPLLQRTG